MLAKATGGQRRRDAVGPRKTRRRVGVTKHRSRSTDAFIAGWLVLQITLPLAAGLDLSDGRYFAGPFTWSMYAYLPLRCEMSLWVVGEEGARLAVEGRDRLAKRAPGPEPEGCHFGYLKERVAEEKTRALLDHLAARRADGRRYGAEIRWTRTRDPDWPEWWRYETQSPEASP